jgi:hypothetical protein
MSWLLILSEKNISQLFLP